MAKERNVNPAAAQRKADKQKALKKGKAAVAAQRNERLAHRNPQRIQSQIDEIKAQADSSGQLPSRSQKNLDDLEHELVRVRKAKEVVGDKYAEQRAAKPTIQRAGRQIKSANRITLGKRERPFDTEQINTSSDTDDGVDGIPMPRDTPPPLSRRRNEQEAEKIWSGFRSTHLPSKEEEVDQVNLASPQQPPNSQVASRTIYESKPIIRDLRKEAIGFVPTAVQKRIDLSKGNVDGRLLQEDELQALEAQGYGRKRGFPSQDEIVQPESSKLRREPTKQSKHVQIEEIPEGN